jgi:hypothetical protein
MTFLKHVTKKKYKLLNSNIIKFTKHNTPTMQEDAIMCELLQCFTGDVDYNVDCKPSDGITGMSHELMDISDMDLENILLSMYDGEADIEAKPLNKKDALRAKNRASAQRGRDADRMYAQLMLSELTDITETFDIYSAYIGQLKCHTEAAACSREIERLCSAHKTNIQQLQKQETCTSTQTLFDKTTKERNRIHAEKSRYKKLKFLQDIIQERDACLITLKEVMTYTTALESSCSLLNDFDETGHTFMQLVQVRQKLLQRTCTHTQQHESLKSHLSFRVVYRSNFR